MTRCATIRSMPGRLIARALLASVLGCSGAFAGDVERETRIKAAVVYKLAKFVEWPDASFEHARSPLRLCLLGDTPLADALQAAKGRSIRNHPVTVSRKVDLTAGERCHVLYVSRGQQKHLSAILASFAHQPVLSVSEIEDFAQRGGIVGLIRRGTRLGFQVNVGNARRAGLVVSTPLLELAEVIGRGS